MFFCNFFKPSLGPLSLEVGRHCVGRPGARRHCRLPGVRR